VQARLKEQIKQFSFSQKIASSKTHTMEDKFHSKRFWSLYLALLESLVKSAPVREVQDKQAVT
jgi:hypothetical protein